MLKYFYLINVKIYIPKYFSNDVNGIEHNTQNTADFAYEESPKFMKLIAA